MHQPRFAHNSKIPPSPCGAGGGARGGGFANRKPHGLTESSQAQKLALHMAAVALQSAGVDPNNHISQVVSLKQEQVETGLALDCVAASLGISRWDRMCPLADYIDRHVLHAIEEAKCLENTRRIIDELDTLDNGGDL